jgi:hypothetical protein
METVVGIVAIVLAIPAFLMVKAVLGMRYWNKCEKQYSASRSSGLSHEEALVEICKERHPELSLNVHYSIINKFNDVDSLVLFLTIALPKSGVDDNLASKLANDTTIQNRKIHIETNG